MDGKCACRNSMNQQHAPQRMEEQKCTPKTIANRQRAEQRMDEQLARVKSMNIDHMQNGAWTNNLHVYMQCKSTTLPKSMNSSNMQKRAWTKTLHAPNHSEQTMAETIAGLKSMNINNVQDGGWTKNLHAQNQRQPTEGGRKVCTTNHQNHQHIENRTDEQVARLKLVKLNNMHNRPWTKHLHAQKQ